MTCWEGPPTLKMQGMSFLVAWITSDAKTELTEKSSSLEANKQVSGHTGSRRFHKVLEGSTRFQKVPQEIQSSCKRFWKCFGPSRSLLRSLTL